MRDNSGILGTKKFSDQISYFARRFLQSLTTPQSSSCTQLCVVLSPFASFSPFASSCEDTAEEILAQIGSGKVCVTGGNWELVSDAAKVKKKKRKENL